MAAKKKEFSALNMYFDNHSEEEEEKNIEENIKEESKPVQIQEKHTDEVKHPEPMPVQELKENKKDENATVIPKDEPSKNVSKVGRPKINNEKSVPLSVLVPESLYKWIEYASVVHGGVYASYIRDLIEKDVEKNKKKYTEIKEIYEQLEQFKSVK